jgi:hypothetical protein
LRPINHGTCKNEIIVQLLCVFCVLNHVFNYDGFVHSHESIYFQSCGIEIFVNFIKQCSKTSQMYIRMIFWAIFSLDFFLFLKKLLFMCLNEVQLWWGQFMIVFYKCVTLLVLIVWCWNTWKYICEFNNKQSICSI